MTEPGLTSEELRRRHLAEIGKSETFITQGVTEEVAKSYLKTPEGNVYLRRLVQADPTGSASQIADRAIEQIISGRELPRMELNDEPLVKLVPKGATVSPYSPFFARQSEFEDALAKGHNISERFGLPIQSEAARYDAYQIKPKAPTEVFISRVAPTSELGGLVTKAGGAEQYLVPNRGLYSEPIYLKSLDNSMVVQAQRGVGADLSPGMASRGLGALGVAAIAYDATTTAHRTSDLLRAGNSVGGQSEIVHFGGRNFGMLAGAELGAAAGAALGVESGPGLFVTGAIGGVAGAIGGNKIADAIDNHRIYNQSDKDGQTWHFDPQQPARGWTRSVATGELDADAMRFSEGMPIERMKTLTASPALSTQLNYQASTTAVQLALAHPGKLQDPYTQPAGKNDALSMSDSPWTRDAQSHSWSRQVTDQVLEHGMSSRHSEIANPARAMQLDMAARHTIADNLAASAQGMAQRYQAAYQQYGWHDHGPMPPAVTDALKTPDNLLQASDGHTYTRNANGQWNTPGLLYGTNAAEGNVREELDATRHAMAPHVIGHATASTPLQLDDAKHPDHQLYLQARSAVYKLDVQIGRTPDHQSDNLAGVAAVAARTSGLQRIDHVVMSEDGSKAFAVQGELRSFTKQIAQPIETSTAVQTSIAQSSATMEQVTQKRHEQAQVQAQVQSQQPIQQPQNVPAMSR